MKKIGLALSGGGFRASLYHLGLVRFLRDAGLLSQVTHITSVSGGSIFAAHLALNWDRYNSSDKEFDAAAAEFIAFIRLDIRNRIARRFPLSFLLRWPRRLLGLSTRRLSRTGLLEYHYEKYLYGDTSLFQLPERPAVHILATNLSEGCLCSFNRNGLLMMRRQAGHNFRLDRIHIGLATVPMAVTASSAFPGFFPPIELTSAQVGASDGEFDRQAYTDGGVFDNLGVRMFRCLARPLLVESPLCQDDFVDFQGIASALSQAGKSGAESPLGRLAQILSAPVGQPHPLVLTDKQTPGSLVPVALPTSGADAECCADLLTAGLGEVLRRYQLHHEPLFAALKLVDADAAALLHECTGSRERALGVEDQHWLNRHLLEAAFRQATERACFRRLNSGLDGVLVSDVGKPFEVQNNQRAGGLIRTAFRATDILMDRVWLLENETIADTPGFVFARITDVVEPEEDSTALHPEIQRQTAHIRTDLDRFSLLEISSLIRHGYCVARKSCRAHPELFGAELPANVPWDPIPETQGAAPATRLDGHGREPTAVTLRARTLQASAVRRIWSTLLDYRDWTSYVYVPILVPILILLPYFAIKSYQRSHRVNQIIESLAQSSRDLELMTRLLEGPVTPWVGESAEDHPKLGKPDFKGFLILQDSRIIDLRKWKPPTAGVSDAGSMVYGYRRLKVLKQPDNAGNNLFRAGLLVCSPKTQVRFPPQQLKPRLFVQNLESSVPGEKRARWDASVDLTKVPAGDSVDLIYEHLSPGEFLLHQGGSTTLPFDIEVETAELIRWLLLPEGKEYRNFNLIRHETGNPGKVEAVKVVTEYLAEDFTILAFKLLSLKPGYTYELTWYYR